MKYSILIILLLFPSISQAYLDPGTMGHVAQALLAVLAGIAFSFKIIWSKTKSLIKIISTTIKRDKKVSNAVTQLEKDEKDEKERF